MNTVDALAGGDITKYDEILNLPYNKVFVKLVLNKTAAEFQKKLRELTKPTT